MQALLITERVLGSHHKDTIFRWTRSPPRMARQLLLIMPSHHNLWLHHHHHLKSQVHVCRGGSCRRQRVQAVYSPLELCTRLSSTKSIIIIIIGIVLTTTAIMIIMAIRVENWKGDASFIGHFLHCQSGHTGGPSCIIIIITIMIITINKRNTIMCICQIKYWSSLINLETQVKASGEMQLCFWPLNPARLRFCTATHLRHTGTHCTWTSVPNYFFVHWSKLGLGWPAKTLQVQISQELKSFGPDCNVRDPANAYFSSSMDSGWKNFITFVCCHVHCPVKVVRNAILILTLEYACLCVRVSPKDPI